MHFQGLGFMMKRQSLCGEPCACARRCMELTDNDPRWAILGWVTGWLNVLGQFATTAFAADILAAHIASMFLIGNGHVFSNVEMLLAYAGQHFCATHQCP